MQTRKDETRDKIIKVAKSEFLQHGFHGASMRTIAKKSGVALSNIYNYFKNKDEIFREVLNPVLKAVNKAMDEHNNPEYIDLMVFESREYMKSQIDMFVELIYSHRQDFRILLFKSSNSSLENFGEEIIEKHTKTGIEYIKLMKEKYPQINGDLSMFFIHTLSSGWWNVIRELVMHDLSYDEIRKFITEYMDYSTAGWKKVMRI